MISTNKKFENSKIRDSINTLVMVEQFSEELKNKQKKEEQTPKASNELNEEDKKDERNTTIVVKEIKKARLKGEPNRYYFFYNDSDNQEISKNSSEWCPSPDKKKKEY